LGAEPITLVDVAVLLVLGLVIGLLIGLLGAGGTVLTVPALVYLADLPVEAAVATSLVLVLLSAVAGLVGHGSSGRVLWREGLVFGGMGSVGAVVGSRLSAVVPERLLLGLFSAVLLAAAAGMLRDRSGPAGDGGAGTRRPWWQVALLAVGVGLLTGFFGVGGGFLAVPALVLALGLPLERATATALVVIVVNALAALAARGGHGVDLAATVWTGLGAVAGGAGGALAAHRVPTTALRRAFGALLVVTAVGVLTASRL
jgi:uncharacterized membrane protein YfcA